MPAPVPTALTAPAASDVETDLGSAADFPASTEVLVPSGSKSRARANLAALELVQRLRAAERPATRAEQRVLAAWSGWGAVPEVFDVRNEGYAPERERLRELLTRDQYRQAEASILNAHYTDPAVVAAIWEALGRAGFTGGRVLEPGCGSGHFIGHAPAGAVMVGVENDPITAAITAALYPSAQIRNEGFETTRVPENSFAATVGNVPFGRFVVHDPAHNAARHSIHNHFINKSLALTAPGGYVAVLTSRYTMDSASDAARRAIAERGELIGALRLPSRAFSRVAGTEVVTDLLVLRRRTEPVDLRAERPIWLDTAPIFLDADTAGAAATPIAINAYLHEHPHHVLGTMEVGHGLHGSPNLAVAGSTGLALAAQVSARLGEMVDTALSRGAGLTATAADLTVVSLRSFDPGLLTAADLGEQTGLFTLRYSAESRRIEYWSGHAWETHDTAKTLIAETRELIALRDAANSLIVSQRDGRPAAERDQLRAHLNHRYDSYVRRHGPINRFSWVRPKDVTQGRHDQKVAAAEAKWRAKEGEPGLPYNGSVPAELLDKWDTEAWRAPAPYKKRRHLDGGMRHDPGWAVVSSLEIFDEATGQARKAEIFSTDLVSKRTEVLSAAGPEEALAVSLDRTRRVDLDLIAGLLDVDSATARHLLQGLVYPDLDDPDELVPATTALSGNVRQKLAAASAAAHANPVYQGYVAALREVMPVDRTAEEIRVRPGAPWIPAEVVAQFAKETFQLTSVTVEHIAGRWVVDVPSHHRFGRLMTETWGMPRKGSDAVSLFEALCNSRSVVINDDKGVLDVEATFAAQAKATKISEEFSRWVFAEEARREPLVGEYNRRFNSLRAPRYDGSRLSMPGLSDRFVPHFYQRNAVARIIAEPTVLLDHVVGAGKSGTIFMSAMELKRLGLVRQPWIVVPNSIIDQIGREAKQWYPAANVLLGSAATTAEGRRRLIAQSAASDWDMVIIPESAFTAIGVSDRIRADYIDEQLDTLRIQLEQAGSDRSKKAIERSLKSTKERLERLTAQDTKDTGLNFENSGADYLFVDEAHYYKNLQRVCNITELNCTNSSERAEDLALKLRVLRDRRREEAKAAGIPAHRVVERVATFATGTPIANSLGELWVMQTYLRPDLLEAAGVADLGDWGAAFTATHTTVEVNATGTKLRPVTRVGKFTNLPELLALSSVYSDVVTRDQVPVELPPLIGGQRQAIVLQPDIEVVDFIADLGYRADHLDTKAPHRDNILKIANDGRNASLDPRLAHLDAPTASRAAAVADAMMRTYRATQDREYRHPQTGELMPLRGSLQVAFCDRGTPSKDLEQFTIYAAIKDELVARGMPAEKIRFVHEARKPHEVGLLREQCINGEVAVLIGSTEKMGTGWNIQVRLAALDHVDVPWRPADLEQREGRILRQGNQNLDGVEIRTYVTEGTYDTVMWQKVQAKSLFIEQVRRNEVADTEIEDLSGGDIGAAAAETKALATGDPRYLRQVELDEQVRRLLALERAHQESMRRRDWRVAAHERTIPHKETQLAELAPVAGRAATHVSGKTPPAIVVGGVAAGDKAVTAERLAGACRRAFLDGRDRGASQYSHVGVTVDGVDLLAARDLTHDSLLLRLATPSRIVEVKKDDLLTLGADGSGAKTRGLLTRVENLYLDLPRLQATMISELDQDRAELADLLDHPPGPFEFTGELTDRQAELATLTLELRLAAESREAMAKAEAAQARMAQRGREPGWSLLHNPTPYVVEQSGFRTARELREALRESDLRAVLADAELPEPRSSTSKEDLMVLRAEVDFVEAAGAISPATVYPPPPQGWQDLDDPARAAVSTITASMQAVQVLTVAPDADKHATLTAITDAVHGKGKHVLAMPATDTATAFADTHRYAERLTDPATTRRRLDNGEWTIPPGNLLVIDDADHLDANQLRYFTEHAARSNTKLLLVHTPTEGRDPAHSLVDALADNLPWAQHVGTPTRRDTALDRAATHLAEREPVTAEDRDAAELLARRDTMQSTYQTRRHPNRTPRTRDHGIDL
ncbi:AAA family ATPase [Mycobacterium sp. URHB0021]